MSSKSKLLTGTSTRAVKEKVFLRDEAGNKVDVTESVGVTPGVGQKVFLLTYVGGSVEMVEVESYDNPTPIPVRVGDGFNVPNRATTEMVLAKLREQFGANFEAVLDIDGPNFRVKARRLDSIH
jgi:hypothetical protein